MPSFRLPSTWQACAAFIYVCFKAFHVYRLDRLGVQLPRPWLSPPPGGDAGFHLSWWHPYGIEVRVCARSCVCMHVWGMQGICGHPEVDVALIQICKRFPRIRDRHSWAWKTFANSPGPLLSQILAFFWVFLMWYTLPQMIIFLFFSPSVLSAFFWPLNNAHSLSLISRIPNYYAEFPSLQRCQ